MIQKGKLTKIVGAANVIDDPAVLEEYSSDLSFANRVRPVCVVKPADAKQIQKLVNLANETQTPLVPVSSGPPHFRGDTVPGIGGAVVVAGLPFLGLLRRSQRRLSSASGVVEAIGAGDT